MKPIQYKKGQVVSIHNTSIEGKPIIEGKAKLIEFVGKNDYPPYQETWRVQFTGEAETYLRTITPS
jgi:hypothetical protein